MKLCKTNHGQVEITGALNSTMDKIFNPEALAFISELQKRFNPQRELLLEARKARQHKIESGELPNFLPETSEIRTSKWTVATCPADLVDRRVEITGPADRKMMINAFNSGAKVFMADLEDSMSPTWANVADGQLNLWDAVRRELYFKNPDGKEYRLNEKIATLLVRPRGWHMIEEHVRVDGKPVSGSLLDFGLYFFHNARELLRRNSGPYFYLPKIESHLEARLWNDVFKFAQSYLGLPNGTIRATVLIETILASFEMNEILYELRDHASGLNAGRWDYLFSAIKKFKNRKDIFFPDRDQLNMTVPFMRAYTELLVQTCHKREAHAMGGMAAFIPNRKDPEVTARAIAKVTEDKERESKDGFDGTWVAHPDLVTVAMSAFDKRLGNNPNQKQLKRAEVEVTASNLLDFNIPGGFVSESGVRHNISVAIQYLEAWLKGSGAVAIFNLMEDAATAEISRSQLWLWRKYQVTLKDGKKLDSNLYNLICSEEIKKLGDPARYEKAANLLNDLVLKDEFVDFLTTPAYQKLRTLT